MQLFREIIIVASSVAALGWLKKKTKKKKKKKKTQFLTHVDLQLTLVLVRILQCFLHLRTAPLLYPTTTAVPQIRFTHPRTVYTGCACNTHSGSIMLQLWLQCSAAYIIAVSKGCVQYTRYTRYTHTRSARADKNNADTNVQECAGV